LICGLFIGKNKAHFGLALYDFGLLSVSLLTLLTFLTVDTAGAKYLAAAACGLQNGLCTEWGGASIRTTHVTGLFTDVGLLIGRMISLLARKSCGKSFDIIDRGLFADDRSKLAVLAILGFSYFFGAYLGAVLYSSLSEAAFLVPSAITGSMGLAYLVYRVKILHHKLFSAEEMEIIDVNVDVIIDDKPKPIRKNFTRDLMESAAPADGKTDARHALERSCTAHADHSVVVVTRSEMLRKLQREGSGRIETVTSSGSLQSASSRQTPTQLAVAVNKPEAEAKVSDAPEKRGESL